MRVLEVAQETHAAMVVLLFAAILSQAMAGSLLSTDFSAECLNGRLSENSTLAQGMRAGDFILHRSATDMNQCVQICCSRHSCELVLFVKERCYEVKCIDREACKPVKVLSSKYRPIIFTKNRDMLHSNTETRSQMITDPNKALIREKRHESCHHYHGSICSEYLDKSKLLYFNGFPRNTEEKLKSPFSLLKPRLSENCSQHALKAICHQAFPYCKNRLKPRPTTICHTDCQALEDTVCYTEFKVAKRFEFLARILPNCTALPAEGSPGAEGCIRLNLPVISSTFAGRSQILQGLDKSTSPRESLPGGSEQPEPAASQQGEEHHSPENENRNENEKESGQLRVDKVGPEIEQGGNPGEEPKESGELRLDKVGPEIEQDGNPVDATGEPKESLSLHGAESFGKSSVVDSQRRLGVKLAGSLSKEETKAENVEGLDSEQGVSAEGGSQGAADRASTDQSMSSDASSPDLEVSQPGLESESMERDSSSTDELGRLSPAAHRVDKMNSTQGRLQDSLGLLEPVANSSHGQPSSGFESKEDATQQQKLKEQPTPTSPVVPTTPSKSLPDVRASPTSPANKMVVVNSTEKDEVNFASHSDRPTFPQPTNVAQGFSRNESVNSTQVPTKPTTNTTGLSSNETGSPTSVPRKPATDKAATPKPTAKKSQASLKVSAGENSQLVLPADTISLYASAWPKETADSPYSYHWQQISAPGGSHGYMAGQDTQRVTLSQLDEPGVYQFKVKVTSTDGAYGYAHVNVTVKPAPRVNKPPRADISPKEQTITLPTNEVVLDGSQSSDDDKIAHYKWEEVKGPLNDKHKVISSGADSPVLQLKSLVPGIYTFKLTVTDSDGASDSTQATVTVNNEKDYPPVARAGNDVVITLPVNHVTLYGNGSTDDKGIVSYEWSKAPSSPAVGDMQGTSSPILKVSNMVVGDYTFMLKVTDRGGQTAVSKVTVVVQPEKNTPPVARAGSDKDLVYPDDTTTLDGKDSRDDQKIAKYHWQQASGPDTSDMSGADERVVTVRGLKEGRYVFELTVTDDKGLTDSDTVAVNVKKDVNKPPVAHAGADVLVNLPNRAAQLDGSRSSDDHGITDYEWVRDPKSPAAGDVINGSDHQAVLRLSNVVEGRYKFKLTVVDAKGLKSSDEAILTVKEDENSAHLVELYLDVDITKFTQDNKEQLIRKLAVILNVQDEDITVEHLKEAGSGHSLMVIFYVKRQPDGSARDGQDVAGQLKEKIENEEGFFEFRMLKVEPYICRNNCSGHGYCDKVTKLCVCESFWMQNFFKTNFGVRETNCDWSILYVTVILFGIIMGFSGVVWGICYCMGRLKRKRLVLSVDPPSVGRTSPDFWKRLRGRKRHRYAILDDDDDEMKAESMEMLPKGKYMDFTDTDEDSDEETTVFEAKKRIMNGTMNGHLRRDT